MKRTNCLLTAFALVSIAALAHASTVTVGDLEFNPLFTGVNVFTIDNFTGANNLGFFPAADNLTFDSATLNATESDGTVLTFDLGNIVPGSNSDAQVADGLSFTQVTFTATLNPTTFSLTNGYSGAFTADPSLSFTLLPSSGAALVAGVDLGLINASPPAQSTVPEPGTLSLIGGGLLILGAASTLKRAHAAAPSGRPPHQRLARV